MRKAFIRDFDGRDGGDADRGPGPGQATHRRPRRARSGARRARPGALSRAGRAQPGARPSAARSAQTQRVERQQVRQEPVAALPAQPSRAGPRRQRRRQSSAQRSSRRRRQQRGQSWSGRRGGHGGGEAYRQQIEESRAASRRSADQPIGGNYARQAAAQPGSATSAASARIAATSAATGAGDGRDGRRRPLGRQSRRPPQQLEPQLAQRQALRLAALPLFQPQPVPPGGYYSPYRNYRYNRLSIGLILDSLFYSNRYWLSDPWQYRLPPAPYGTQWVRYYDDVLLIDVYTGEVIDVIYDFFW